MSGTDGGSKQSSSNNKVSSGGANYLRISSNMLSPKQKMLKSQGSHHPGGDFKRKSQISVLSPGPVVQG